MKIIHMSWRETGAQASGDRRRARNLCDGIYSRTDECWILFDQHLLTHWRIGQKWFEECLVDWDVR